MTQSAMPVYNAQGEQVILGREVGQGLRAVVFLVRNRPDQVARLYLEPPPEEDAHKIEALTQMFTPELEAVSTWPVNTLFDLQQAFAGYLRPFLNLGDYRELPHLYSPALRLKAFPRADWAFHTRVAAQVAHSFNVLHAHGQVMGDVSPLNVMVNSQGRVKLVNVDGYQVRWSGQEYRTPVTSLECLPPELQEQDLTEVTRTENHDNFGLAVLIFQLLMAGHHPYAGIPDSGELPSPARAIASDHFAYSLKPHPGVRQPPETLSLSVLPESLQSLFERAFSPAHEHRPSAQEWAEALNAFAAALVPCEKNAEHRHQQGRPCPWCELEGIRQVSPFVGELHGSDDADIGGKVNELWQQVIQVSPPLREPVIPEVKSKTPLPELALDLPSRPNAATEGQLENIIRWVLRIAVLGLLFTATITVQHSILAGLVLPAILIFAFTLGRRMSVDWDKMIESYQNWEGRLAEGLLPARGKWQAYHQALNAKREELGAQLQSLNAQRKEVEARYERENAHAEYQRDLAALEDQRRALLQSQERQHKAVESLLMQRRERGLSDYLRRQPLTANLLPHLDHRALLQLNTQGIRTAYDVQPEKLQGVPEAWHNTLSLWRQGLEDFLPVSADLIAPQELAGLRVTHAEHLQEGLEQFQRGVNRFLSGGWGKNQQEIVTQVSQLKAQASQMKQALKQLENLAKQG